MIFHKALQRHWVAAMGMALVFVTAALIAYWYPSIVPGGSPSGARAGRQAEELPSPLRTPGPPTWTLEDAKNFTEFPLYWLGDSFEGLPLTQVYRREYDPPPDSIHQLSRSNAVYFIYGDCNPNRLFGPSRCNVPLSVMIEPNCARSSLFTPDSFPIGDETIVGGVPARYVDEGQVVLWAGTVTITVMSARPAAIRPMDAAEAVRPLISSGDARDALPSSPDLSGC